MVAGAGCSVDGSGEETMRKLIWSAVDDKDRDQLQWKFVPAEVDIAVGD
jgi:hypothetical protein